MGFLDSILGKTRLPEAKTDKLFAISTAAITLEANLGLKPDGAAAVCIKPMDSSRYEAARAEVEDLLKLRTMVWFEVYWCRKAKSHLATLAPFHGCFVCLVLCVQECPVCSR